MLKKETHKDFSVASAYKDLGLKNILKLKFYAMTTWRMERLVAGFENHRQVFKETMQIGKKWFNKTTFRKGYLKAKQLKAARAMKKWIKSLLEE